MVFSIIFGGLVGFAGHQTEPWIRNNLENGLSQLVAHTLGVLITFPVAAHAYNNIEAKTHTQRFALAWFVAFFGVGLGTLCGWIFDG